MKKTIFSLAFTIIVVTFMFTQSFAASKSKGAGLFQLDTGEIKLKPLEQGALNAVINKDPAALKLLLSKGVSPNLVTDSYGNTLLLRLFQAWGPYDAKSSAIYSVLAKAGANPSIANKKGETATFIAALSFLVPRNDLESLKNIGGDFATAPKCSKRDKECIPNTTALMILAKNSTLNQLIKPGPNYTVAAAEHLEFLLKNSDISAADAKGRTALHYAVDKGYFNLISTILKAGADPKKKDKNGLTPEDMALQSGRSDLIELLSKYLTP